jgi:acetate kinase
MYVQLRLIKPFHPTHRSWQNHHAVMAVRSCLDALPDHTSILLFDTLFHVRIYHDHSPCPL